MTAAIAITPELEALLERAAEMGAARALSAKRRERAKRDEVAPTEWHAALARRVAEQQGLDTRQRKRVK